MTTRSSFDIQKLYLTYFGRPADPAGLQYWQNIVDGAHGDTSAVVAAFAATDEYKATFAGKDAYKVVADIYLNLFGRLPEPTGVTFWGQALMSGALTIDKAVTAIAGGALNNDLAILNNKVTAAIAFTNALDTPLEMMSYKGTALTIGRNFLDQVTDNASLANALEPANLNLLVKGFTIGGHGGQAGGAADIAHAPADAAAITLVGQAGAHDNVIF